MRSSLALLDAPTTPGLPRHVVDVWRKRFRSIHQVEIQQQFVGRGAYHAAYTEAASFVTTADTWHQKNARTGLSGIRPLR